MIAHDTRIERVRDVRGYDIGYTATCAVHDWAGDLRERPTQALIDIEQHLTDTRTKDGP